MAYLIYPTSYKQVSTFALLNKYFPYRKCIPIVNRASFIINNDFKMDISNLDNRKNIGVPVISDLVVEDDIDIVYITEQITEKSLNNLMCSILDNEKKIFNCSSTYELSEKYINSKLNPSNESKDLVEFRFFEECLSINQKSVLFDIHIPIIGVGGLIGYCNQSEITSKISLELNLQEVNTKAIVTEKTHLLVDSAIFPDEIFNNQLSFQEKAILLNHYIKFIITKYNCQALVIEIPGGVMKFSNQILNDLSHYVYLFIESMPISKFVLCAPINKYNYEFYKYIISKIDKKYEWETIGIHISNVYIEYEKIKLNNPDYLFFRSMDSLNNYVLELRNLQDDDIIIESYADESSFIDLVQKILLIM